MKLHSSAVWALPFFLLARCGQAQEKIPAPLSPAAGQTPASVAAPTAEPTPEISEADEAGTSFSFETDFNSRYVFRGLASSEGPVVQPGLYASRRGYTLGVWGNINGSRRVGSLSGPREWNEVDLSLSKSIESGPVTIEPAVLFYLYPTNISPTTGEISLRLTQHFKSFSVYTGHSLDFAKYRGAYFGEIGLEKEREFSPRWSGAARLSLGFGNGAFNEVNIGPRRRALNVAMLDISLTRMLNERLYVRPHLGLTHILDGELRAALEDPTLWNVGLAVGGDF